MALQGGSVVHDQKLNSHLNENSVGWKTDVSKVPKKGVRGGRKPLGDLSNSLKPSLNQASKKHNSGILSFTEKEATASQNGLDAAKKKSISKPSVKPPTSRKALSDISNSGKPNLYEGSKKNYNARLSLVAEEPMDDDAISEERFLHNHQECIKAQSRALDLDEFLQIIGLDNGGIKQKTNSLSIKSESPPRHMEMEEMAVELIGDEFWSKKMWSCELDSPPPCRSPKSPKYFMHHDYNFQLLDSP
ncbi:protein PATRONUS 1 isoform X2 [Mercurialis annua]|uniref:protein PATRONUS 1 isoform X2 n=1 Tax=Mercurialis annua TaxID=3986 RepID=UPI00215FB977|nr:protein PATRONUS 1 isoform X2 [Mercurialis annua]